MVASQSRASVFSNLFPASALAAAPNSARSLIGRRSPHQTRAQPMASFHGARRLETHHYSSLIGSAH